MAVARDFVRATVGGVYSSRARLRKLVVENRRVVQVVEEGQMDHRPAERVGTLPVEDHLRCHGVAGMDHHDFQSHGSWYFDLDSCPCRCLAQAAE